ncbi:MULTISPECIES: phosphoribosyltransferase [Achromobacter]|uniref:phosphoribosyltransferase n=1 Tax=Achromobacter TaxID=222 RepID=UPI0025BB6925|nr:MULTISPECIES: phosphoribosyltransferase [Achromobacter]
MLISNHDAPTWFNQAFGATGVKFLKSPGRQSGEVVRDIAKRLKIASHDVFALATKAEDVQMGKNAQAVLVAGSWANDRQVSSLGIRVDDAQQLQDTLQLVHGWSGQWWFSGQAKNYGLRALSNLSSMYTSADQADFGRRVTATVKNGGPRLMALLAITSRSLLMDGVDTLENLLWGVYPSSKSKNDDSEVLSDFTHRLRTTVSRVRLAKAGLPLFIRHTPSTKRSASGGSVDRTDPSEQIQTIHLNPEYKKNIKGRNVVVVDDCTTYGVSFGVAAAFLVKAGAASVRGIALGKFGSRLQQYEIDILSDPFAPVGAAEFKVAAATAFPGMTSQVSQQTLLNIFP